ncbi:hypothetical protein CRG98_018886 [Punica granatum]|uniref:Uncharacterized protein n=1 Tax=Punica granatum TaxID=22663 RepID=A0A2I0JWR4_PUNGR|nr:hypothetical protein CRG98_018886 [Punica granatum]
MTVPMYAWFLVLLGEPLTMDGGSRLKGVNSLKSSGDLWGPVRWHSRLDLFPYSEPLTNLASYIGARGISDKQTRLGSVHLPGDVRRAHVRRSRHLPFYDPKVEGRQVTRV